MKVLFGFGLLLSLSLVPALANAQNPHGLEVLSVKVKDDQAYVNTDAASGRDLPESVTRPNTNAGRPRNRTEGETERIERTTNQRIQNMHVLENAKLDLPRNEVLLKVYQSRAELRNASEKTITEFAWAYRASPELQFTEDQQFLCRVSIKAGETKAITAMSLAPDRRVVKVDGGGDKKKPIKPSLADVVINRVEFADGTTWQRPDWNPLLLAGSGARVIGKGKCGPM